MKLYVVTANLSDHLDDGSLIESTTVNAEDIYEAMREAARVMDITYDRILSVSMVRG